MSEQSNWTKRHAEITEDAKDAALFRRRYNEFTIRGQRDSAGVVTAEYIAERVRSRGKKPVLLLAIRQIGPEVPRDSIDEGEPEIMLAVNLTTGMKRLIEYAGAPVTDEDGNSLTLASVTASPDDPGMVSVEPGPTPTSYWLKDEPASGTGETNITEAFTDSNDNVVQSRGIVTVSAGPIAEIGDATIGDEVDRDDVAGGDEPI